MNEIDKNKFPKMYALNEEIISLRSQKEDLSKSVIGLNSEISLLKKELHSKAVGVNKIIGQYSSIACSFSAGNIVNKSYNIGKDEFLNVTVKDRIDNSFSIITYSIGGKPIDNKVYRDGIYYYKGQTQYHDFLKEYYKIPLDIMVSDLYPHTGEKNGTFYLTNNTSNCGADFAWNASARTEHLEYLGLTLIWAAIHSGKWMTFFSDYENGAFGLIGKKVDRIKELFEKSSLVDLPDYGNCEYQGISFETTKSILNVNSGNNILSGFIGIKAEKGDYYEEDEDY